MIFGLNISVPTKKTIPVVPRTLIKLLFSDNSLVLYKAGRLAPGGIGTVRNSRRKATHT